MHTLVVGITESGKTSLCKKLAAEHIREGYAVLVLSKIWDEWPKGTLLFDDQEEFLRVFWASEKCMVFIDEGKSTVGRYNDAMIETAVQGRHWGHSCYYAAQRATMMSKDVREQCTQAYIFKQGPTDAKALVEEFAIEGIIEASKLKKGECLWVKKFGDDGQEFIKKIDTFNLSE